MNQRKVAFFTLGCKVNQQETAALVGSFAEAGFSQVGFKERADVYVINSCAVTTEAERKSLSLARKTKQKNPQSCVVLAGCSPQVAKDKGIASNVDVIVGSNNKAQIPSLVDEFFASSGNTLMVVPSWGDGEVEFENISDSFQSDRARATLKIQDGCEQFCAYCIIPYARGPERSLQPAEVMRRGRLLVEAGYPEVVLTGIHLGAYGHDLEPTTSLSAMVSQLLTLPGLNRLRLGSVEPVDIDEDLIDLLAQNNSLCKHLHIPLQSGSDAVLKGMGRKYTVSFFKELVERLRSRVPDIGVTTDVIVGFPGEGDEDFADTISTLSRLSFLRTHVFRYSRRPGTRAADLKPQVPEAVKTKRAGIAQKISLDAALANHLLLVGTEISVLAESWDTGELSGHSESYARVLFSGPEAFVGHIGRVRIDRATETVVFGQLVQD